jgi:hypothetical protein
VLGAKSIVIMVLTFVVVEVIAFVAFFIGQALISGHAPTATLGQTGVLRALIGSGLYGALLAMMGLAFGTIIRSAAGAIAVLVAILYVLPGVAGALPTSIEHTRSRSTGPPRLEHRWPQVVHTANTLSPWAGFGVFLLFVAILSGVAFTLLNRRDAVGEAGPDGSPPAPAKLGHRAVGDEHGRRPVGGLRRVAGRDARPGDCGLGLPVLGRRERGQGSRWSCGPDALVTFEHDAAPPVNVPSSALIGTAMASPMAKWPLSQLSAARRCDSSA